MQPEPTPPAPQPDSLLAAAVRVAEAVSIPRARREENLTSMSEQLLEASRLLVKAGRSEEAMRLVAGFDTPGRVKAPSFVPIAVAAIRSGNKALVSQAIEHLAAMQEDVFLAEWTAPIALADIAVALEAAGDHDGALRLARRVNGPEAQARAFLELGRLDEALQAAQQIPFQRGRHVSMGNGITRWMASYGARLAALLSLVKAHVERADLEGAQKVLRAMSEVSDDESHLQLARGWLEIARRWPSPALDSALAEVSAQYEETLADTKGKLEILGTIAERLIAAGREDKAIEVISAVSQRTGHAQGLGFSALRNALATTAHAFLRAGHKPEALALLAQAASLLDRPAEFVWEQDEKVHDQARLAALLELAGEAGKAEAMLAAALAGIAASQDEDRRSEGWSAIAKAYAELGGLDRAVAILTSEPRANGDKWRAVYELQSEVAEIEQLRALLPILPGTQLYFELAAKLAGRLDETGRREDARALIFSAVNSMAMDKALCDYCLVRLANEYPSSGAPADAQLRRVLQTLVERARPSPP